MKKIEFSAIQQDKPELNSNEQRFSKSYIESRIKAQNEIIESEKRLKAIYKNYYKKYIA